MGTKVLILGAGGHGWVVADILLRMRDAGHDISIAGFLDDAPQMRGRYILGLPVLAPIDELGTIEHDAVVIAIGNNQVRQRLFVRLVQQSQTFLPIYHPSAVIAPDVTIGMGSVICAGVVVNPGSSVGVNAILNTGCTVDHHNQIGDHAHIAPGVHLGGDVAIGEGTLVGIGATVMPQHSVGAWSVVGAGALVTKDIPSWATAIGSPARVIQTAA